MRQAEMVLTKRDLGPSVATILVIARKKLCDGIHSGAKSGQNPRVLNRGNLKKAKMKGRKGGALQSCPGWRPSGCAPPTVHRIHHAMP
jgi:hypothetical protein